MTSFRAPMSSPARLEGAAMSDSSSGMAALNAMSREIAKFNSRKWGNRRKKIQCNQNLIFSDLNVSSSLSREIRGNLVSRNCNFSKDMVKIRLRREGAKGRPYYRIVVADSRARREGAYIEQIGTYDPMKD